MKPKNGIKIRFQRAAANTNPQMDKVILEDVLTAYRKNLGRKSTNPQLTIRRIIKKSRIIKYAVFTAIIILAIVGGWILRGIDENDLEQNTKYDNDLVAKKSEDKPIETLSGTLKSNDPVEKTGKSPTDKKFASTISPETRGTVNQHLGTAAPDRGRAALRIVPMDRERMNVEAKKIREMAAVGDIDGLVATLSAGMFRNKVAAAEHLGEVGDERALPELIKLKERFICGLSKDGSTVFKNDGYGYRHGISSGAFAVAICKIMTRNLSVKEQIDAWFELLDDCIEPEMASKKPYLVLGRHGLLDIPINEFGYGCFDLGKRVAAELEKYNDPSIVTRLRKTENKGAAIAAVWMEVQDMAIAEAIERCVEIAKNEHEAQQYGAIKCLGKLGEDAIFALDDLAMQGHYEAMRTLGYRKENPEVLDIICWHLTNNRNFLVRLLAVSQFSHMNILRYQQPILLQALVEALYDPHEPIRRRAASLLRTIAEGKNKSQLFEYEDDLLIALKHPDKQVRGFTAQTLNRLGSKRLDEQVPDPPEIRTDLK
ncbi:MAG: hypothetical protein GWN67_18420 [Phycisphaerae bacterium]|nr:hypothetical protein [Phycisphaerae bacterium]NIP54087.1 hypothetical protein [Phycisphaerae bacterium]NIS53015.1 hypothetical protein [Phycisphaerae bacterium]NIU10497.1 hypothetical protein [Phycisphaerae bacterium]NIU58285.1 hypothetical protein [Phycisphaerae bacterium]